ncbi:hypothetical protein NDU88_005808 [Pleurodeles waltl]|uniref:Uncharacterized protein n=1 Tax=Pleurodeles waltl TaxID=8319 RepID=A0AAV7WWA7_PLEWA|nr:hypothetical protein NDU88_005808 [Pleurodeles waltl]
MGGRRPASPFLESSVGPQGSSAARVVGPGGRGLSLSPSARASPRRRLSSPDALGASPPRLRSFGLVQPAPRRAPLACTGRLPPVLLIPSEGETASAPEWGAMVRLAPPTGRHVSSGVQRRPRSWVWPGSGKAPPRNSTAPSQPILQFCSGDRCCRLAVSLRSLFEAAGGCRDILNSPISGGP